MFGLIIAIIAGLIGLVMFLGSFTSDKDVSGETKLGIRIGGIIVGLIGIAIMLFGVVAVIPENAVGVQVDFGGKAKAATLGTGINFKAPWVTVHTYNYQTEIFEAPELDSSSSDLQQVTSQVTVNWHINPEQSVDIYKNFRQGLSSKVLVPSIEESLKATTARYVANDLISKREEVRETFKSTLRSKLTNFETCTDCVRIVEVNLGNFDFSDVFDQAIESKQKAEQLALEQQNVTLQKEEEAKQIEAIAKGEAAATIARANAEKQKRISEAEGLAEAIKLEANAQAEAIKAVKDAEAEGNKLIAETITDDAIRWQVSQALENGTFDTIILPPGADFILGDEIFGK